MADAAQPLEPKANAGEVQKAADALAKQIEDTLKKIEEAKKANDTLRENAAKSTLKDQLAQAETLAKKGATFADSAKYLDALGGEGKDVGGGFKAMTSSSPPGGNSGSGGTGSSGGNGSTGGAKAQTVFYPPASWGQDSGGTSFSADAYMQSLQMTDSVMSSWAAINANQKQGRRLQMLFAYFARMAASGDMGAMYQFMKFLTYVISKDKAAQQVKMGEKLIELQALSRKWTDKLMNTSTNSTDSSTSDELMKTMTLVKSETDSIATSQKLISQMMEEFAQVVEALTNTTKSTLEANGKILSAVSRFQVA